MDTDEGDTSRELKDLRDRLAVAEAALCAREIELERIVAEREAALKAQRKSSLLLEQTIESLPDMVFVKDAAELRFELFNRAGEELLGYPRAALLGKNDYDFFPPDQAEFFISKDREALAGKAIVDIPEEPIRTQAGEVRYLHTKKVTILDEGGEAAYLLGISQDITEFKRVQDQMARNLTELAEANRKLVESDHYKDEFLAVISHELRTPLNFIMGFASILEDGVYGPLNPAQHESLIKLLSGAERMLGLVNDLLDVAKIQAGKLHLVRQTTALGALVEEVVETLVPLAHRKEITLKIDSSAGIVAWVDGPRVIQILTNLIGNAIKFTPAGGHVMVRSFVRDGNWVAEVSDTGIGITSCDREELFMRFRQIDMSSTREQGGTGLGLAIAKALVEAHGGAIGVESKPGQGSTFWFSLPLDPQPQPRAQTL